MRSRLDWNLVVTADGGRRHDLVYALRPIVRLTRAGYSEVLIGRTDDVEAGLAAIATRADATFTAELLARVVPVTRTFALATDLEAQLLVETAAVLDDLVGRSFQVRVERRGHKGIVQSDRLERTLSTALVAALRARRETPRVTFRDPEVVVAVELIGEVGGVRAGAARATPSSACRGESDYKSSGGGSGGGSIGVGAGGGVEGTDGGGACTAGAAVLAPFAPRPAPPRPRSRRPVRSLRRRRGGRTTGS